MPAPGVAGGGNGGDGDGDPAEAKADAEPLTYYIDPSVPAEWRGYMKTAVEAWRPAFQAAGLGDEAIRGAWVMACHNIKKNHAPQTGEITPASDRPSFREAKCGPVPLLRHTAPPSRPDMLLVPTYPPYASRAHVTPPPVGCLAVLPDEEGWPEDYDAGDIRCESMLCMRRRRRQG